jgi:hypothetical protein
MSKNTKKLQQNRELSRQAPDHVSEVDLANVCGGKIVECGDWSRAGAATGAVLSLVPNSFVWAVNALGEVRSFPRGTAPVITALASVGGHILGKKIKTCREIDPKNLSHQD